MENERSSSSIRNEGIQIPQEMQVRDFENFYFSIYLFTNSIAQEQYNILQ